MIYRFIYHDHRHRPIEESKNKTNPKIKANNQAIAIYHSTLLGNESEEKRQNLRYLFFSLREYELGPLARLKKKEGRKEGTCLVLAWFGPRMSINKHHIKHTQDAEYGK